MNIKEFSNIIIERNKRNLNTNIIIVGSMGYGLDNLCVSICEEVSSKYNKLKFKDSNYMSEDSNEFLKLKNSLIIKRCGRSDFRSLMETHKFLTEFIMISRHLNNVLFLRDISGELSKSSLLRVMNYKISFNCLGEIFVEDIGTGKIRRLEFDLRKINKRAERIRYAELDRICENLKNAKEVRISEDKA